MLTKRSLLASAAASLVPFKAISQIISYAQADYLFIPRYPGQPPETGTYWPIPAGGTQFATGITANNPVGNWWPMYLPSDFPQTVLINSVLLAYGTNTPSGNVNEFTAVVDPGGQYYKSAGGAEQGGVFIRQRHLARSATYGHGTTPFIYKEFFALPAPVLFDQTAGDMIEISCAFSDNMPWIGVVIGYLQPNTFQPS